jgi:hypothetical protein
MDSSPELAGLGEYGYEQMMGYPVQIPDPVLHDTDVYTDINSGNYNCLVCVCIILILVSILCTILYFLKIK